MVLFKHRLAHLESQQDEETKNSEQLLNQTVEKINQEMQDPEPSYPLVVV